MSALGLARDSMTNLAALYADTEAESSHKKTLRPSRSADGLDEYNVHDEPLSMDDGFYQESYDQQQYFMMGGVGDDYVTPHGPDGGGGGYGGYDDYYFGNEQSNSEEKGSQDPSYGTYSGFDDDFYYDDYGDYDLRADFKEEPCCFFPWFSEKKEEKNMIQRLGDPSVPINRFQRGIGSAGVPQLGSKSTSSPAKHFGKKEETNPAEDDDHTDITSMEGIKESPSESEELSPLPCYKDKPKKGILKTPAPVKTTENLSPKSASKCQRRSLFVNTYQSSQRNTTEKKNKVHFSPMAKVTYVTSCQEMSLLYKTFVWWQRSDFEDFKKTARIIAKAMLTGGSEIWLQTSDVWHAPRGKKDIRGDAGNEDPDEAGDPAEQKWWCKFGHSRRGLEHIVCQQEGKERQQNVALAISSVIEEYQRQKLQCGNLDIQSGAAHNITRPTYDDAKLANVSARYTSWARDLALAAGLADADAVANKFSSRAKPRSYFLGATASHATAAVRLARNRVGAGTVDGSITVGDLTQSVRTSDLGAKILDAYTHSHQMGQQSMMTRPASKEEKKDDEHNHHKSFSKSAAGFGGDVDGLMITAAKNH